MTSDIAGETDATASLGVLLADGTAATIRRVRPEDRPAVAELFATGSPADLYRRFFTVGTQVVERHISHLFDPGAPTTSYVLERADEMLGICDVEQLDPHRAEVAFFVAGGSHGLGVGTLLLEHAADEAWTRGITTFVADVLAVNHPMIEVFRDAGFDLQVHCEHENVSVSMSTLRTPSAIAATAARHQHAEDLLQARESSSGQRSGR